jgi:hypothetical protein
MQALLYFLFIQTQLGFTFFLSSFFSAPRTAVVCGYLYVLTTGASRQVAIWSHSLDCPWLNNGLIVMDLANPVSPLFVQVCWATCCW